MWSEGTAADEAARQDFRAAMRHFAGNVSVVTAGIGEDRSGLVALSAVSLSVDPPQMLVCVNREASTWPIIRRYRHFGVNSLVDRHQAIAERFSGKDGVKGVERYRGAEWITLQTGASLLADAAVAIDCAVEDMIDRATHSIIIGSVKAVRIREAQSALVYWRGAYRSIEA